MKKKSITFLFFLLSCNSSFVARYKLIKIPPKKEQIPVGEAKALAEPERTKKMSAVTYTFSGGRFGDNLTAYLHAKWISYKYNIPLLYKPFPYSDQLMMHELETEFQEFDIEFVEKILKEGDALDFDPESSTLYIIPYFPESREEFKLPHAHFPYFEVDWDDQGFVEEIRKMIQPRKLLCTDIALPNDKITVAVHVRKCTPEFDAPMLFEQAEDSSIEPKKWHEYGDHGFPFKFARDEYYIEQIRRISTFFGNQPLYVYLFTDAANPHELAEKYKTTLQLPNIEFDYRKTANKHDRNVLEDFFALTQFDCLIRVDSNFSLTASKLASYKIQVTPKHFYFHRTRGYPVIDEVSFTIKDIAYIPSQT
jgi:hypothetical protein